MPEEQKNVCDFKKVCKTCTLTFVDDRPGMCVTLQCPEYKPCLKCGNNNYVNQKGYCVRCQNNKMQQTTEARRKQYQLQLEQMREAQAAGEAPPNKEPEHKTDAHEQPELKYTITEPGTPPPELTSDEVRFYKQRWEEYKGYYHNPAAYFAVHQIIQEEIYISRLTAIAFAVRGERAEDNVKARNNAYQMLDLLRRSLPDKESEELSEYEKSMAAIYEKYVEEKSKRYVGGVARMLSPSAVALAPNLIHPMNPMELLERMGFEVIDMENFIMKYETISSEDKLPPTPLNLDIVMNFFGYRLKEKYAMDFKTLDFDEANQSIEE